MSIFANLATDLSPDALLKVRRVAGPAAVDTVANAATVMIVAGEHDDAAVWAAANWPAGRGVAGLVTPTELAAPGWRRIIDDWANVRAVIPRMPCTGMADYSSSLDELQDRASVRVLNQAAAVARSGPDFESDAWTGALARAGLPPFDSVGAIGCGCGVLDGRTFGSASARQLGGAVARLARWMDLDFVELRFGVARGRAWTRAISLTPDLTDSESLGRLAEWCDR